MDLNIPNYFKNQRKVQEAFPKNIFCKIEYGKSNILKRLERVKAHKLQLFLVGPKQLMLIRSHFGPSAEPCVLPFVLDLVLCLELLFYGGCRCSLLAEVSACSFGWRQSACLVLHRAAFADSSFAVIEASQTEASYDAQAILCQRGG